MVSTAKAKITATAATTPVDNTATTPQVSKRHTKAAATTAETATVAAAYVDAAASTDAEASTATTCTCGNCTCGASEQSSPVTQSLMATDQLPYDDMEILAAFFKALADPTRLNIVFVLLKYHQLSVGDIAAKTKMSISAVSHQLAILRMRKLVTVKRDGVKNFYALCDNHVSRVIELAIEHVNED